MKEIYPRDLYQYGEWRRPSFSFPVDYRWGQGCSRPLNLRLYCEGTGYYGKAVQKLNLLKYGLSSFSLVPVILRTRQSAR